MLLSIIIPTKNRYSTLFQVVDTILGFDLNEDIEIVIQDNSDNNEEALSFIGDRSNYPNLRYFYSKEKLSVIENSDKAVLNSVGEYVSFIGDDDCVLPNILEVITLMRRECISIAKCYKPSYYWPGQRSNILSSNSSGVLRFNKSVFSKGYIIMSCEKGIVQTFKSGGVNMDYLPCLYHGIVKREVLSAIFNLTGTFFPGPSPDMANGVALACVSKQFLYYNMPFVISGKSTSSTGGAGVLHKHISRIEDVSHLPSDTAVNWEKNIPKYWTGPTIWAESFIKGFQATSKMKVSPQFNYEVLYAYLYVYNYQYKNVIFNDFNFDKGIKFYFKVLKLLLDRTVVFVKNRMKWNLCEFNDIVDIREAIKVLSKFEKKNRNEHKRKSI